jgi:hypothetical protein
MVAFPKQSGLVATGQHSIADAVLAAIPDGARIALFCHTIVVRHGQPAIIDYTWVGTVGDRENVSADYFPINRGKNIILVPKMDIRSFIYGEMAEKGYHH